MSEFTNRVAAQRLVLQQVNRNAWEKEELFGLSSKAIDRWLSVNRIDPESRLVNLVRTASEKLFFLANKSQEQISDEYRFTSKEIWAIAEAIEEELTTFVPRA